MSDKTTKTERKNQTNVVTVWPEKATSFILDDVFQAQPTQKPITIRTRLKKLLEAGTVKEVGILHTKIGRPKNVYTFQTVDESLIAELSKNQNFSLSDKLQKFNVATTTSTPSADSVSSATQSVSGSPVTV